MRAPVRRPLAARLIPILAALIGVLLYHRFSLLTGLDRVQADTGDSRFVAFLLEHWNNALHGRAAWNSPPIFWPERNTLAYSDLLIGMGALQTALRPFLGVFAAMNLQLILLSLATFATAYALLTRGFRLSIWAATAGAYFFAFSWPRFAQLVHIQLQFTALLPILALLALECLRDGRDLRRAAFAWRACAFVVLLVLTLATALYYAIFAALTLTVALALCLLHDRSRAHLAAILRQQAAPLIAAATLGAVLLAPIVYVYLPVMRVSQGRPWTEVVTFLPTVTNLFWMGPESLVWGWLFERWPAATILLRRPELRIGVGAIVSLAWIAALLWALAIASRPKRLDIRSGTIAAFIITGFILQLLMLRLPGDRSAWWLIWKFFPGATGIRGVARLELVVTLPMALGIGVLIDRTTPRWRPIAAALALLAAVEQLGATQSYSGASAEALSRRVGAEIPASCKAAYIVAPPDLIPSPPPPIDPAQFDAQAYLTANPDVAAAWKGTPWEHYDRFGRAEHRSLDPAYSILRSATIFFAYNYTVPLAAALRGIPVVDGLSGWEPKGWNLFDVLSPDTDAHVESWLRLKNIPTADVCVVPIRITLPEIPDPPARLMP
jgi:hypothetical protein